MPYFDRTYFDPTYFLTDSAPSTTGGHGGHGGYIRRKQDRLNRSIPLAPTVSTVQDDDDFWLGVT